MGLPRMLACTLLIWLSQTALAAAAPHADQTAIGNLLDNLHATAAAADFDGYFALYHPQAVFIGTDRSERWPLAEFKAYAAPHFAKGSGWTYTPLTRNIDVVEDTAWFHEHLQHARFGRVRGTGTLLRTPSGWLLAQYHLTLPIPNELLPNYATQIAEHYREGTASQP